MIPPNPSLVKYENPVLVSTSTKKGKASKQKGKLPPVDSKQAPTQTEDILNSILPPREWTEDGQLWVQYVSSTPATRLDVINLQEALDQRLQQRQARKRAFARSARSYTLKRSMNLSDRSRSTVRNAVYCFFGYVTSPISSYIRLTNH